MRPYPLNSPQAAARIVAMTLLADGTLNPSKLALVEALGVHRHIGLPLAELHHVLQGFCEDLPQATQVGWDEACTLDQRTMAWLFAEIDDPALRRSVLRLCVALAEADQSVCDGESLVLTAAIEQWGLHTELLTPAH
jgi:hypothetical protein